MDNFTFVTPCIWSTSTAGRLLPQRPKQCRQADRSAETFRGLALGMPIRSRRFLVAVFLEAAEYFADFIGSAQVGNGIGKRVMILEPQQRR